MDAYRHVLRFCNDCTPNATGCCNGIIKKPRGYVIRSRSATLFDRRRSKQIRTSVGRRAVRFNTRVTMAIEGGHPVTSPLYSHCAIYSPGKPAVPVVSSVNSVTRP